MFLIAYFQSTSQKSVVFGGFSSQFLLLFLGGGGLLFVFYESVIILHVMKGLYMFHCLMQDIDESENADNDNQNSHSESDNLAMDTLETAAGDSTPLLMPPDLEEESPTDSPDEKPSMEVFELQESSSESISPDMESQALFIKLKEVRSYYMVLPDTICIS